MPQATVGDISIHYDVRGEGEPLVLINGYGGNSRAWFLEIPTFSPEFRVVTFDNRGTGDTDKPDITYTMAMMADDVSGLLDALDIEAAHVYGVSMGGMIAQEFTLRYPNRVISLVLGCTTCGGRQAVRAGPEVTAYLFDADRMKGLAPEEAARQSLPFLFTQEYIDANPELMQVIVAGRMAKPTPLQSYLRQAEAIFGHDTYDRLPDITAPTLVIAGTADRLVPVENSRLLASRIPNAELVLLEGMGHGYLVQAAEEANKAIHDFLSRHRSSS